MRRFLGVAALIALAGPAFANDLTQGTGTKSSQTLEDHPDTEITDENIGICEKWGRFAEHTMEVHQSGWPLADWMKLSPDPRSREIILEAYATERFRSESQKKFVAESYRDKITAECLTSLSGSGGHDSVRSADFWQLRKP